MLRKPRDNYNKATKRRLNWYVQKGKVYFLLAPTKMYPLNIGRKYKREKKKYENYSLFLEYTPSSNKNDASHHILINKSCYYVRGENIVPKILNKSFKKHEVICLIYP
jgi:hypothetical protein